MIKISKHQLKKNSKTLIIAEIGQSHLGNFKNIKSIIKKVSKTGAEFIKFQTHYASEESTLDEPFRVKIKNFKNRLDYWKKMEFSENQWKKISDECKKNNLTFLSSPFSEKAVEILSKLKVSAWKIGSGEFFSKSLLDKILKFKQPIILSTGLATLNDISNLIPKIKKKNSKLILMQCTSSYPCKIENIGVNVLKIFQKKFKCLVGLSDHSGSIYPSIYAMINGASLVEVHVGDKKNIKNPDNSSSLSFEELTELVKARDIIYILKKNNVDKTKLDKKLLENKQIFTKSCALRNSKKKGEILKKNDITFKKPGTGIPERNMNSIIGKKLIKDLSNNRLLKITDFLR